MMKTLLFSFLLLFAFLADKAGAATLKKSNIIVSVGDLLNEKDLSWKKETCARIYLLANQIVEDGANIVCRNFDTHSFKDKDLDRLFATNDYHMRILRSHDGSIGIDVTKLHRIHETDFLTLGWNFKDATESKVTKEEAMNHAIGNFFFYVTNEKAFKAMLLVNGLHESEEVFYDQKNGFFKDKFTGERLSINAAYSRFEHESERKKNYLRTGVEIGVLLSSAMAIYYKNLVYNQVDFDYELGEGIRKKLNGSAIRLDDNDKNSNYGHVYAGVMYYQMARANGFNSLESFLITFASSTTWEFMEYHEVLSINDEILTPIGGYVIGEATYQISCALLAKKNPLAKALGYTLNPGLATNHSVDSLKQKNKFASQPDCKRPRWSDISIFVGLDKGQKPYEAKEQQDSLYGMDATVVNIGDYQEEGKSSKLIVDTAMAKMLVEINGNEGFKDLRVISEIVAAAYHEKNLGRDKDGLLRGYDLIIGVGSGTTWNDRGSPYKTENEDFYGTIDVLGASAHANIHYKGLNIVADFSFYGDFTMVKSYALRKLKDSQGESLSGFASTLEDKGYYWGLGTTLLGALSVQKGKWQVSYHVQNSNAKSIKGHHRLEEEITRTDVFRDSLTTQRLAISYQLTKNLKFQVAREYDTRSGTINGDFKKDGTETRTTGTLIYKF